MTNPAVASSLYERVGGANGLRVIVKNFYDLIETHPAGAPVNLLHLRGHGINHSRGEQIDFLSGFLGGPNLYAQRHGHSNVRLMHQHIPIDEEARSAWLACMSMALDASFIDRDTKLDLMTHFESVAIRLQNTD